MQPSESEKSQTRELLLDAAEHLFSIKGYAAVSTREVAEVAGVNLGAIQYHFGSKAALFADSIRRTMHRTRGTRRIDEAARDVTPKTAAEARTQIILFIRHFLNFILRPEGPATCRMLFREILSETVESKELSEVLISSAVSEFMTPVDQRVRQSLQLLRPELSADQIDLHVQSVVGQCSFYLTHAPLLKRLRDKNFSESPHLENVAAHVARFSLEALGSSPEEIVAAFDDADREFRMLKAQSLEIPLPQ